MPHSSQIPHVCAEETFWRRFWSSFCTGISLHPSGSADVPSGLTCLQKLYCSEGKRKASPLVGGGKGKKTKKKVSQCFYRAQSQIILTSTVVYQKNEN